MQQTVVVPSPPPTVMESGGGGGGGGGGGIWYSPLQSINLDRSLAALNFLHCERMVWLDRLSGMWASRGVNVCNGGVLCTGAMALQGPHECWCYLLHRWS